MKHAKEHYRGMKFHGMVWQGFDDGVHLFVEKTPKGFAEMAVEEEQLTNGDAEFMAKHGLTLDASRIKAAKRRYERQQRLAA